MKLKQKFFQQNTITVAQKLLGKVIVRKIGRHKLAGIITETEAYCGPDDLASHASKGKTERTALMFGPAGYAYIYLIYGMYYCFNIVTEKIDYPAAVLIRAVEPITGIKIMKKLRQLNKIHNFQFVIHNLTNGPGKFCQAFDIDKKLNGENLTHSSKIWIEDQGLKVKKSQILATTRNGVDYAREYKDKPWRFYLKNNIFVSKI